jgi:hypothetical protein
MNYALIGNIHAGNMRDLLTHEWHVESYTEMSCIKMLRNYITLDKKYDIIYLIFNDDKFKNQEIIKNRFKKYTNNVVVLKINNKKDINYVQASEELMNHAKKYIFAEDILTKVKL